MKSSTLLIGRIVAILLILALGYGGMVTLSRLAKAPERKPPEEIGVRAQGLYVQAGPVPTQLMGYGTAKALSEVEISPEVGGRVVEVHPDLKTGNVIRQGELILRIDPDNYRFAVAQLQGDIDAISAQLTQSRQMETNDQRRLELSKQILELSRKEYERIRKLTEVDRVETRSRLESQQQELKTREDQVIALENNLKLYPSQIQQFKAQLESTQARLDKAQLDLEKTAILAPFTGRVVRESVEQGQIVGANSPLVTLADDSILEIVVPLEGEEAMRWLDIERVDNDSNWFGPMQDVPVTIRWVERPGDIAWSGLIARVETYDANTRSVNLAIRVGREALPQSDTPSMDIPLVDGMFCKIEIPGRIIPKAFKLPRSAVSEEQTVLAIVEGRIQTRAVEVVRFEEDWAYIISGLQDGEEVLTTRPAIVLDGTKVDVTHPENTEVPAGTSLAPGTPASEESAPDAEMQP